MPAWRWRRARPVYKPTKRGGGGPAQGPVVAGADPAQSAFRGRHQGPGRLAHLLRAAGRLGPRRQPPADPRRDHPGPRGRHAGRRRKVGDLEAEAGRDLARRQALHRRRCRLHLGICARSRDRGGHQRLLQGCHGREDRPVHREGEVRSSRRRSGPTPSSAGRAASFPSTCSPTTSAPSRARRRPTSSRSAPGPTCSRTSSRATWSPA